MSKSLSRKFATLGPNVTVMKCDRGRLQAILGILLKMLQNIGRYKETLGDIRRHWGWREW